jgi:hypothetical protein
VTTTAKPTSDVSEQPTPPSRRPLLDAIDFKLFSELLRYDFLCAVLAGVGGAVRWAHRPLREVAIVGVAAGLVGVVIGAVIAAAALQAAFMDRGFLLKVAYLGYKPSYFLAPALFTATVGVFAALACVVILALPAEMPTWADATAGGVTAFFVVYTIVSLIPVLRMIVEFTDLKATAARIDDDDPRIQP